MHTLKPNSRGCTHSRVNRVVLSFGFGIIIVKFGQNNFFYFCFQLKQQMEERTKLLECLSNEKETVAVMEKEKEDLRNELEEMKNKFEEVDEALKEVRTSIDCERK